MAPDEFRYDVIRSLRDQALTYPEVNEGSSCVKRAFKARTKGFLYLGEKDDSYNVMVKLSDSFGEATARSETDPDHYRVGSAGWVTMDFAADETPPPGLIERWIDESFRLQAPMAVIATLEER